LRAIYNNPDRYGLALQIKILTSFLSADKDTRGIIERLPLSSRYIFGNILYNFRIINDAEMDSYHAIWDALTPHLIQPTGAIYVVFCPSVYFVRTTQRARDEEKTISREYLHELHDAHEAVFPRLEQPVCKDVFQNDSSLYAKAVWIDRRNFAQQVLGAAERALNYLRA
jgi:deoxyadenosine/deoxycytidine kinase